MNENHNELNTIALYVFIRKDMKPINRYLQAGYAIGQFLLKYPNPRYDNQYWNNKNLIYLEVDNNFQLNNLYDQFRVEGRDIIKHLEFENDYLSSTAIAVLGSLPIDFLKFKKLSENTFFTKIQSFINKLFNKKTKIK